MNHLVATNIQTMSSREMADLTEKRHDNVKRTIDALAEKGVISQPQIEDGEKSANGVVEKLYRIGKRDSFIIVAQLSPEFTARTVERLAVKDIISFTPSVETSHEGAGSHPSLNPQAPATSAPGESALGAWALARPASGVGRENDQWKPLAVWVAAGVWLLQRARWPLKFPDQSHQTMV